MRLHVHVGVSDLDQSIAFYNHLFGTMPSVIKDDYAKWMLEDPRVNFAISQREGQSDGAGHGVRHLGVQVDDSAELATVYERMKAADRPVLEEGATTCCYAKSEKSWIADPDGVMWETFLTTGESTVYGGDPALGILVATAADDAACCTPETPQGICCEPKEELPASAPCCN